MIPVEQTRLLAHEGNCHAACIASILHANLDDVPQATVEELASVEGWQEYQWRLRRDFLNPRNLYDFTIGVRDAEGNDVVPPGYAILVASSPRTGGYHSVVALNGEIVWDPHPGRSAGVGEWHIWVLFAVLDPSKPVNQPA